MAVLAEKFQKGGPQFGAGHFFHGGYFG
jgi:hypothetical protein